MFQSETDQAEQFVNDYDFDNMSSSDPLLDTHITVDDTVKAVGSLKRNKAYGIDNLLNEYVLDFVDIISSYLCDICNAIFKKVVTFQSVGQRVLSYLCIKRLNE